MSPVTVTTVAVLTAGGESVFRVAPLRDEIGLVSSSGKVKMVLVDKEISAPGSAQDPWSVSTALGWNSSTRVNGAVEPPSSGARTSTRAFPASRVMYDVPETLRVTSSFSPMLG